MQKFIVTIEEIVRYRVPVEARSPAASEAIAIAHASSDGFHTFLDSVTEREIVGVELLVD
ncbi:hypothetical protein ACN8ZM_40300 (plasmid) [Burkholderia aenigmatica]|uniref:hypothetical protein n=1 Tax=Burkholderia aenigmatica TaxID=2015348 RepID=UPI003B433CA6